MNGEPAEICADIENGHSSSDLPADKSRLDTLVVPRRHRRRYMLITGKQPKPQAIIELDHVTAMWRTQISHATAQKLRRGEKSLNDCEPTGFGMGFDSVSTLRLAAE